MALEEKKDTSCSSDRKKALELPQFGTQNISRAKMELYHVKKSVTQKRRRQELRHKKTHKEASHNENAITYSMTIYFYYGKRLDRFSLVRSLSPFIEEYKKHFRSFRILYFALSI